MSRRVDMASAPVLTRSGSETILSCVSEQPQKECRIVRPDEREVEVASGGMVRVAGVSESLAGATGIHLAVSTIPPGCASTPHHHVNCESAIYVVKGRGRFITGSRLERADAIGPGDFIYVPPGAVHQPVNDSTAETMELIVARNAPVEIVVEYAPVAAESSA